MTVCLLDFKVSSSALAAACAFLALPAALDADFAPAAGLIP